MAWQDRNAATGRRWIGRLLQLRRWSSSRGTGSLEAWWTRRAIWSAVTLATVASFDTWVAFSVAISVGILSNSAVFVQRAEWTSPGRGPRASGSTIRQGPRHGWSWRTGAGRWSRIDPGQRLDQRSTLDAKVAAHGCLRHAIVQRSKNGIELLADYHRRSPTHPAATPSRCQPCHHPLSCEGALVLCERAENMEQQFPGGGRRIHAFGE